MKTFEVWYHEAASPERKRHPITVIVTSSNRFRAYKLAAKLNRERTTPQLQLYTVRGKNA